MASSPAAFYRNVQQQQVQRDQGMKDAYRSSEIKKYDAVATNINSILASGIDPQTQKPLSDEQRAHLNRALGTVQAYSKNLYNPDFDAMKGEVPEDPMHKLAAKVGIVKPHQKPPAEQMTDLQGIISKYSTPAEVNPLLKDAREMREAGFSEEDIATSQGVAKKTIAPPTMVHNWKQVTGTLKDGSRVTYRYDARTGLYTDLSGNQVPEDVLATFKPDVGKPSAPRKGWGKDDRGYYSVLLDKNTNQEVENTRNYGEIPPTSILGSISTGFYHFVDEEGNVHSVPETRTRKPITAGTQTSPAASTPPASKPAGTAQGAAGTGATPATAGVGGSKIIGKTLSKTDQMIQRDAIKTSDDIRTMTVLLETQKGYMSEIRSGERGPTPRQDLSLIVAAVRAMNPGTVRLPQKELELELKAGSFDDRIQRAWDNFTNGTLPDSQREDLYRIVEHETSNAAKQAAQNWEQVFKGKRPVPAHLKPYVSVKHKVGDVVQSNGKRFKITNILPDGRYEAEPAQ